MASSQSSLSSRFFEWLNSSRSSAITTEPSVEAVSTVPNAVDEPYSQGLDIVAEGVDPVVDIVAVHGLNGHREKTWTASNGVHWLSELLPHDVPQARIFSWGYDANTHSGSRVSCKYLYDHALALVSDLCRKRKLTDTMERPIIFVAHSLGGIVVKSALIHSDAARQGALEEQRSIKVSTYGIIFMGTPHQGGNGVKLGKLLANISSIFMAADDRILKHLERDSEWLQQQLLHFGPISGDFVTKFAYEEYKTPTALGHPIMVVPRASAVVPGQANAEQFAIPADHRNMVKYTSSRDGGYIIIMEHLQLLARAALNETRRRWEAERRTEEARLGSSAATFAMSFSLSDVYEVDYFVARGEELAKIHHILSEGAGRRTAVVHGLGGMGKTQLAAEYAKLHQNEYSAVFWLNARDETSLKQGFANVAKRILIEHPSTVPIKNAVQSRDLDEVVGAVKYWLDQSTNNAWLMIYDNYDYPRFERDEKSKQSEELNEGNEDEEDTDAIKAYDIKPFLPNTHHGAILITTRSSRVSGKRVPLGKLRNLQDSLEILSHTSGREGLDKDEDAIKLAEKLDGFPLALSTAGAYLFNVSSSFADYMKLYRESWLLLEEVTPELLSYEHRTLFSTWNITYKQIRQQNTTSAKLLQLWAYFDNEDLWFELLQEGHQTRLKWFRGMTRMAPYFDRAVRILCEYGLAEADTTPRELRNESRGYSMHDCVHLWTKHVLNRTWDSKLARLAMKCVGSHVPEKTEPEYWVVEQRLVQHADSCFLRVVMEDLPVQGGDEWMLSEVGRLYFSLGWLDNAMAMYKRAIQGYERALGPDHISTLETVNNLGTLFINQGRLNEAEVMLSRALQGKEKALGPDHTSTLNTVNNLGTLFVDQGRLNEAEMMLNRVLQGHEKALGPDHTLTLRAVNNLGSLYRVQGRFNEAEVMLSRALSGLQATLGESHATSQIVARNIEILKQKREKLSNSP